MMEVLDEVVLVLLAETVVVLVDAGVEIEVLDEVEVDGLESAVDGLDEIQECGGDKEGANRLLIFVLHAKTWCIPHGM